MPFGVQRNKEDLGVDSRGINPQYIGFMSCFIELFENVTDHKIHIKLNWFMIFCLEDMVKQQLCNPWRNA